MTERELAAVVRGIGPVVRELIAKEVAELGLRLAMAETTIAALGNLRDRVIVMETQNAQPVPPPDQGDLRDRLVALETKAASPSPADTMLSDMRERVGTLDRTIAELREGVTKELGTLRERITVAEVRQLVPGPAGRDGQDGLGFDDLDVLQDSERTFTIRAARGDQVKAIGTLTIPVALYRGVWNDGTSYERGDEVTWAGSQWHCNEATTSKPGEGTKAWTLQVKRGRDGKDGRDGRDLVPVVKVS